MKQLTNKAMTKLKKIWIERAFDPGEKWVICIDWDNGRCQRVVIKDACPESVARGLKLASLMVEAVMNDKNPTTTRD